MALACFLFLAVGNLVGIKLAINATHKPQHTADRLEALTQRLCDSLSLSRIASNTQIRRPLRANLLASVKVLEVAATNPVNAGARARLYRRKANELRRYANDVVLVPELTCQFQN